MVRRMRGVVCALIVVVLMAFAIGACISGCKKEPASAGEGKASMKGSNTPNPKAHMSPDQAKKGSGVAGKAFDKAGKKGK